MKVSVEQTVEVSDADRALIAEALGQKTATRQDLKDFLWKHGEDWRSKLTGLPDPEGDAQPDFVSDDAGVLGAGDDDGLDLI
jgi:FlaG/FlaF family flagellin (archaellin)